MSGDYSPSPPERRRVRSCRDTPSIVLRHWPTYLARPVACRSRCLQRLEYHAILFQDARIVAAGGQAKDVGRLAAVEGATVWLVTRGAPPTAASAVSSSTATS